MARTRRLRRALPLLTGLTLAAVASVEATSQAATPVDVRALEKAQSLPSFSLRPSGVVANVYGETQRFTQLHGGVPVLGGSLALRLDGGAVKTQTSALARGLRVSTTPSLTADDARRAASTFLGRAVPASVPTKLVVIPQDDVGGYLAYQLDAWSTARGPRRVYVDAHDGTIRGAHSLMMHANGRIYATDPGSAPVVSPLANLASTTTLDGRASAVGNWTSGDLENGEPLVFDPTAKPDTNGDYLFEPEKSFDLTDAFAQVNAYYHIDQMDQFFRKLGIPMGYGLQVVVNYAPGNTPYDNAFFTPYTTPRFSNLIVIGEGSGIDFAYDSDVFMHEFTHYVNNNTVNFNDGSMGDQYGLNPMPGALDEGTADYFACTVNDDPILGGAALAAVGGQRDLTKNPGKCPDVVFGESHMDGGLIGNATWRIRQALGRDAADPLILSAIQLLHKGASFADFAGGILTGADAAVAKGTLTAAKAAEAKAILDDLGLTRCGRAVEITKAASATSGLAGLTLLGQYFGGYSCKQLSAQVKMTSLFQYKYVAGANDKYVKFNLGLAPAPFGGGSGPSTLDYSLYVRKGNMVTFTGSLGGSPYKPKNFDFKVEHLTDDAGGSIALGPGGVGDLEPGATYYVAVLHANCPTMEGTMSVEPYDHVPDTDAGVDAGEDTGPAFDAGPDGGGIGMDATVAGAGCNCQTTTRTDGGALAGAGALGLALALVRRRRTRG
jgi:MYXO-CTERM domain-containing protein